MASANLSFTKDGLIYRPQHLLDDEDDDFLTGSSQKDAADICRVCRTGATPARPLFHPCLCTGSIKYIHQECLVQWLKHSGKSHCELCKHEFIFSPIYHPNMPKNLSVSKFLRGVVQDMTKNVRRWLHLSLVAFVWLFIMPICIYRIYRVLFYGTLWSFVRFPLELFSIDNLASDGFYGLVIVLLALLGFISVVWLQDQIRNGGGPQWLEQDRIEVNRINQQRAERGRNDPQLADPAAGEGEDEGEGDEREEARHASPEQIEAAREVTELQAVRTEYMKRLQAVQAKRFDRKLEHLRICAMELTYDLGAAERHLMLVLRGARMKHGKNMESWREAQKLKRLMRYREEEAEGDEGAMPPESYQPQDLGPGSPPPPDWGEAFTNEELTIMRLYRRDRRQMDEGEREEAEARLREIKQEQARILRNHEEHTQMICQVLMYGEHYVFGVAPPDDDGEGEGEREGEEEEEELESAEVGKLLPIERSLIRKLRAIKFQIAEAMRKEQQIASSLERQNEDERGNRWFNRLLGRNNNDQMDPAARRQANQANRPNIGRALVGLARDRPPEPGRPEQAEEITWARLLGLDGTYRFLEHVVWLICLVSVLIVSFIFIPYQIGRFAAAATSLWDLLGIVTWKGAMATFIGYIIVCCVIIAFYYGMGWIRLPRVRSVLGVTYVAIKVGMILTVEAGIFPLMCGWWIDICAFGLFGSNMASRQESLQRAPGTITFLHWLAGMIFIFYLASFVMLLREVLRPGVLWFLRNLNDQNFHPVQEMIGLPMQRHLRRFVMSCLMFGVCVMFALLIPSRLIVILFPSFLPLNLTIASSISPIREIQLELILLQFVVPTLLEHGNSRAGLKFLIRHWARISASLFGLQSYLLDKAQTGGDVVDIHENVINNVPLDAPPDAEQRDAPVYDGPVQVLGPGFAPFKPYLRPHFFYVRVVVFLLFTAVVSITASIVAMTLPVSVGRLLMSLVGVSEAPDIYTAAIGLYAVWLVVRAGGTILHYTSQGLSTLGTQISVWSLQGVKCLVAGFLLLVVIPLLLGHLVDLVFITPLRVPSNRTPLFYPSTEWALGLLHAKCICGAVWLTNIPFKQTLDQVYQAGVRNLNLTFIFKHVAWPVIASLSLIIAIPYITFMGIVPLAGLPYENCLLMYRYFFPTMLFVLVVSGVVTFVVKQVSKLYEKVKTEKYLVGRQLVNYGTSATEYNLSAVEDSEPVQESGEQ